MTTLHGRCVAVTGGAGGIGSQMAAEIVRRGGRVAIGDIDEAAAKETASGLGGAAVGLRVDVTDRVSFAAFLEAAERELGPLDVLVNNAGIMPTGPFLDESDAVARRQVDINVHGVVTGCKLALEHMLPRQRGHLVNVASAAGYIAAPGVVTYCGTKHAVVGISDALRLEFRGQGIRVTTVLPGVIDTPLTSGLPDPKGLPKVPPSVVATAVVDAIERPRSNVFVPRRVGVLARAMKLLPPDLVAQMLKVMGSERGYLDSDVEARAAYDRRVKGTG